MSTKHLAFPCLASSRTLSRTLSRASFRGPSLPGLVLGLVVALWGLVGSTPSAQAGKCPNLVIVLDKSGSMTESPSGGTAPPGGSKWDLAKVALKELLKTYDGQLPIGIGLFASDSGCGAARLDVPPDYDTAAKISALIDANQPNSSTPTSESITSISKEAVLHDPSRGQFMLLLTDGVPSCAASEPTASINAITAARMQSPSITTFVLGFGALPGSAATAMDNMAVAGGAPSVGTPKKFYTAEDLTSLKASLEKIFAVVLGEGSGLCDDSCYAPDVGCPTPGDTCIRGKCQQNPCANVSCGPGLYCFTDGISPGRCISSCKKACQNGYRCEQGVCVQSACPSVCIAGFVCNAQSGHCEKDPLCPDNPPRREQCRIPSACQFGTCVDDPCKFVHCPARSMCVPWNGSCKFDPSQIPVVAMDGGTEVSIDGRAASGCAIGGQVAGPSFWLASLLVLCALLIGRRLRQV